MTGFGLKCSFCGRPAADVAKMVAGRQAYICDACVKLAADIMQLPEPPYAPPTAPARSTWRALAERILGDVRRVRDWLGTRATREHSECVPT